MTPNVKLKSLISHLPISGEAKIALAETIAELVRMKIYEQNNWSSRGSSSCGCNQSDSRSRVASLEG